MKRKTTAALLAISLSFSISVMAAGFEKDLGLLNGGFEEGLEKWSVYEGGDSKLTGETDKVNSGGASIKISNPGEGDMSIWQVHSYSEVSKDVAPGDKVKVSVQIWLDDDVDSKSLDAAVRLEVKDTTGEQKVVTKSSFSSAVQKGKWILLESPQVRLAENSEALVISFVSKIKGTIYIDDIRMIGCYSQAQSAPSAKPVRDRIALTLGEWSGIDSVTGAVTGTAIAAAELDKSFLNKETLFGLNAKGSGSIRLILRSVDHDGYSTVIGRSKTFTLTDEPQYVHTDFSVILRRSDYITVSIITDGEAFVTAAAFAAELPAETEEEAE